MVERRHHRGFPLAKGLIVAELPKAAGNATDQEPYPIEPLGRDPDLRHGETQYDDDGNGVVEQDRMTGLRAAQLARRDLGERPAERGDQRENSAEIDAMAGRLDDEQHAAEA